MRKSGIFIYYILFIIGAFHVVQMLPSVFLEIIEKQINSSIQESSSYIQISGGILIGFLTGSSVIALYFLMRWMRLQIFGPKLTYFDIWPNTPAKTTESIFFDAIKWTAFTVVFLVAVLYSGISKETMQQADMGKIASITIYATLIAFIAIRRGFFLKPYMNHDGDERYKANLFAVHVRSTYALIALCALISIVETTNATDMFIGTWFIFLLLSFHSFNKIFLFWFEFRDDHAT